MKEIPRGSEHCPDFTYREALPLLEGERNLNHTVLVRINPSGEEAWRAFWKGDVPIERDEEGYTLMQLFQVAQIFGPYLHNNLSAELPINPTYFEVDPRYDFRIGRMWESNEHGLQD